MIEQALFGAPLHRVAPVPGAEVRHSSPIAWTFVPCRLQAVPHTRASASQKRAASFVCRSGTLTDCGGGWFARIAVIAAVTAPLIAGCLGPDDSKNPWMAHDHKCEQLGFQRGTPEHINCRFEHARQATPRGGEPGTD